MDRSLKRSHGWPLGWIGASAAAVVAVGVILSLSGCVNMFSGVDHPSGDAQILSLARADLDAGDYQDAMTEYQKLSSAYSDIQNSEEAYTTFAQYGASMEAFAAGFGDGKNANIGSGLTGMANSIIAAGNAGLTARLAIYNAFIKYQSITDNQPLSALVEFLGATAFASEVLAEMANGGSSLTCADVESASNPVTACAVGGPLGTCSGSSAASCGTAYSAANATASPATLDMINASLLNIQDGIQRLGGSGTLTNVFSSAFTVGGVSIKGTSACSGLASGVYANPPGTNFMSALVLLHIGGC